MQAFPRPPAGTHPPLPVPRGPLPASPAKNSALAPSVPSPAASSTGDRVVVCFDIGCGHCFYCNRELFTSCVSTGVGQGLAVLVGKQLARQRVSDAAVPQAAKTQPGRRQSPTVCVPISQRVVPQDNTNPSKEQEMLYGGCLDGVCMGRAGRWM